MLRAQNTEPPPAVPKPEAARRPVFSPAEHGSAKTARSWPPAASGSLCRGGRMGPPAGRAGSSSTAWASMGRGGRIEPRRATLVWAHVASLRTQRGHVGPQAVRCPPALSQPGHRPLPPGPSSIPPDRSLVHGPIGPVPLRRWCRHVGHHHRRPCSAAWVGYVHRRFRWRGGPVGWIVDLDRTAGDAL